MNDSVLPLPQTFSLNFDDISRGSRNAEEVVTDLYAKLRPQLLSYVYRSRSPIPSLAFSYPSTGAMSFICVNIVLKSM
jgi:hypothetical protein